MCRTSVTGQQLMLNSDMCLLLDIFNETSGGTSPQPGAGVGGVAPGTATLPACTYDTCGESPAGPAVRTYATDNTLFMADFTAVWIKMATKGYAVCDLSVVPSKDAGAGGAELYKIDEITAECEPVLPEFFGPVTTGVLGDPGPVTTGVLGGAPPPEDAGVDEGPPLAPMQGRDAAGLGVGPGVGPAEAPTSEVTGAPEDAVTEQAIAAGPPAMEGDASGAVGRRGGGAAVAAAVMVCVLAA